MKIAKNFVLLLFFGALFLFLGGFADFASFSTRIIGQGPDPYQYIWNAFNFSHQLSVGQNPFNTSLILQPEGTHLYLHTYTPIIGVLNTIFNNVYLSCNIALLLNFSLSGWGAYLLGRHLRLNPINALIVGFIFAFSPFKITHLYEHYHLLLTATVPFFVLLCIKAFPKYEIRFTRINLKYWVALLLLGLVTVMGDYYTTFYLILFSLFFAFYCWIGKRVSRKIWIIIISVGFIVNHLILEPIHIHKILDSKGAFYNTADLFSLITPHGNSWLYQFLNLNHWREMLGYKGLNEQVTFIGFSILLLACFTLLPKKKKTTKPFLFILPCLLFFLILCFPKVKMMGNSITYSPLAFFHYLPFLNHIRNPSRAAMMLYLFLPIWVLMRFQAIHIFNSRKNISSFISLAVLSLLILEYWPIPYNTLKKSDVENAYLDLKQREGTIWNIPTGLTDGFEKVGNFDVKNLQRQIEHGLPLIGGYISRIDSVKFKAIENDSILGFYNSQKRTGEHKVPRALLDINAKKSFLLKHNVKQIVIDEEKALPKIDLFIEAHFAPFILETKKYQGFKVYHLR